MINVARFTDHAEANKFMENYPPIKNGIFVFEHSVVVIYENQQPYSESEKRNSIYLKLAAAKDMEIDLVYSIEKIDRKIKASKGGELEGQAKELALTKSQAQAQLKDTQLSISVLEGML